MELMWFYGIVSLLPLFFLYQIYRDIMKKKARRSELTRFFKTSDDGKMEDAIELVNALDSIVPGVSQATVNRLIKDDTKGLETIITVLDVPYYLSRFRGFVPTQPDFNGTIIFDLYPFLIKGLVGIGRSSVEKLKGALEHPNRNVRLSTVAALAKTKSPAAIRLIAPFLDSADVEERMVAIAVMGELHAITAVEKIIDSLRDSNLEIRELSVCALKEINDVRALPALETLARTDQTVIDYMHSYTMKDLAEDAIKSIQKNNPVINTISIK